VGIPVDIFKLRRGFAYLPYQGRYQTACKRADRSRVAFPARGVVATMSKRIAKAIMAAIGLFRL